MNRLISELLLFVWKQAQASLFAALFLSFVIVTMCIDLPFFHRYDYLFIYAVIIQIFLVVYKFETKREVIVICAFHIVATVMELFKTSDAINSWHYPGEAYFMVGSVPLFAGFMYSAVGSYIARAWKLLDLKYTNYPALVYTCLLSVGIYINFFSHHFIFDFRYFLIAGAVILFWKTRVHFKLKRVYSMPLLLGFLLISLFVWFAENIATYTGVWLYPSQEALWVLVSPQKIIAWFLLMIISFVLVSLLYRKSLR